MSNDRLPRPPGRPKDAVALSGGSELVELRGESSDAADIPSPCVSICVLDAAGRYCTGCFRTLDEIGGWVELSIVQKRALVAALPARRATGWAP